MFRWHSHFLFGFGLEGVLGYALERSLDIDSLFCGRFEVGDVPLGCAPGLCLLLRNLKQQADDDLEEDAAHGVGENALREHSKRHTTRLFPPSTSTLLPNTTKGKFSGSDGLAWEWMTRGGS